MKRFIFIFTASVYFLLSVGIHIHLHYCCNQLADVGLLPIHDSCCGASDNSGYQLKKHCCDFEEINVQIEDDQRTPRLAQLSFFPAIEKPTHAQLSASIISNNNGDEIITEQNPPPLIAAYKLHCSFVYYG